MGFSVAFSIRNNTRGVITHFDAGDDQYTICNNLVTLEATVLGDTYGHIFYWEQISGSAVTWLTPQNQLNVSFSVNVFDDKVFRFWIDKGTGIQRFDDLVVYATPTSQAIIQGTPSNAVAITDSALTEGQYTNRQIEVVFVAGLDVGLTDSYAVFGDSNDLALRWKDYPLDQLTVQHVIQKRNNSGVWEDVGVAPANSRLFAPVETQTTYRVVAVTNETNGTSGIVLSNEVWWYGEYNNANVQSAASSTAFIDNTGGSITEAQLENYVVQMLTLESQIEIDDVALNNNGLGHDSSIVSYEVISRTLLPFTPGEDQVFVTNGHINGVGSITDYLLVGSVQVGG